MEQTVNTHYAKTHLSRLLAEVAAGQTVIIARAGKPVAKLVPLAPQIERRPGRLRGIVSIGPEFFEPLPEDELLPWEGEEPDAASS